MKITHRVIATIRDEHGNVTHVQEGKNAITDADPVSSNNGLVMMLDLLSGKGEYYTVTEYVSRMKLGTGTPGDSGLGSETGSLKTTTFPTSIDISDPTAPEIDLRGTWDSGDGALSGITEAGLFNSNVSPKLFAYKTFSPALSKTTGGTLTIDWTIVTN